MSYVKCSNNNNVKQRLGLEKRYQLLTGVGRNIYLVLNFI